MASFEVLMPKLGESIEEATIIRWFIKTGDKVQDDDILLEIATDKVDSEIPSPVSGTVINILYPKDAVVPVGKVIAVIDTSGAEYITETPADTSVKSYPKPTQEETINDNLPAREDKDMMDFSSRYYSPLVRKIASEENISHAELDSIQGSGRGGRVRKEDLVKYLDQRSNDQHPGEKKMEEVVSESSSGTVTEKTTSEKTGIKVTVEPQDEIVKMDRMRKLIAEHMVMSKRVSAHVTNMIEADVTSIVLWRNRIKDEFFNREKVKLTYLPVFLESVISALKDYPVINASVENDQIILHKSINLGIAVALATGNLIVPVIKNADHLNLLGLVKTLNKLADDARGNKLNPDDIRGGTFTISNFGTFSNVMGTPIINQPQVAVLGVGIVEKKPSVIETPSGDMIAIRHKMFLSLTYDHRIIDGAYGGAFLKKLTDYLEAFDIRRTL